MKRIKRKDRCEICHITDSKVIDYHHIIPRTDPRCTNDLSNLAIICSNCHRIVHSGDIIIEGVYLTTTGTKLFWHRKGEPHIIRKGVQLLPNGMALIEE